ncbi:nucleotide exchange factor GrpE [Oleidesulfovibrio sp.]|uniref:nucleotide exchange factor GrpE n=1 Tax=Oleidesulfovibrio sp. TaxID=2909707 RepID=UPI003A898AA8
MANDETRNVLNENEELTAQESADEAQDAKQAAIDALTDEEIVALCKERVCPACDEHKQAEDVRLRALAELENVKKRLEREREEQVKYAAEKVLADLLPTLDHLDLALQYGANDPACKNMAIGVEMTRKLFLDALATHGLKAVGEKGDVFDPALHEAVGREENSGMDSGMVFQVMQRGYQLKERLLRPAKVVVTA